MPGLLDGVFDSLGLSGISAGLQSIGNGGSVIGALTGNYTDPTQFAGTMPIGDYSMPRVGAGELYQPPQQQAQQPPTFGGNGSFASLLGNPNGLIARLRGGANAGPFAWR
jgi:hypothetical protein